MVTKAIECGFVPLGNFVVVLPDPEVTETPGGLLIPEAARERVCEGIVVAIGPGLVRKNGVHVPMSVRVRDRVTFSPMRHATRDYAGRRFLLMREPEIQLVHES